MKAIIIITTPPCHKIDLFKRPCRGSRFEHLNNAFVLIISLIFLYTQKMLISVRWPLNSSVKSVRWFYAVQPPILETIFIKGCHVQIIAFPFMLFHRDRFFNFLCLFRHQFSAAYRLEFFLLPQRVHTTLYIKCDKPELTRLWLYSLHAGVQMSPHEVVCNFESEIALSARMSAPSFAGSRCAFRFDQEGCCPRCNPFS